MTNDYDEVISGAKFSTCYVYHNHVYPYEGIKTIATFQPIAPCSCKLKDVATSSRSSARQLSRCDMAKAMAPTLCEMGQSTSVIEQTSRLIAFGQVYRNSSAGCTPLPAQIRRSSQNHAMGLCEQNWLISVQFSSSSHSSRFAQQPQHPPQRG